MLSRDCAGAAARTALALSIAFCSSACGSAATADSKAAAGAPVTVSPQGPKILFEYTTLRGQPLSTHSLAGRISAVGFVTTYDAASQAQARFLAMVLRRHTPRINVALLVLEPPENQVLAEVFADSLHLPYPVALADAETIAGRGPFTGLHHVPSVVILDAEGREASRHIGLIDDVGLDKAIRAVEALRRRR